MGLAHRHWTHVALVAASVLTVVFLASCGGRERGADGVALPQAVSAPGSTVTFIATADTTVRSTQPTANYGRADRITVDASPHRRLYVRFKVTGLSGAVTRAVLRVHTVTYNAGSPSGGTLRRVPSSSWSETGMTWNNRPAFGPVTGSLGAVKRDTWYDIDVTEAVLGDGTYSFTAASTSTDAAYYDSRESGHGPRLVITTGDPVVLGAGDIASSGDGDEATAALLDTVAGTVITFGDNSNGTGSAAEFAADYAPTWGRHKARTRPTPGNHDYRTAGAAGYFGYFGAAAGVAGAGWYSYDLGSWHIVALNSNVAHHAGSPQERWLRADLAASTKSCTLAYWHHPRFTSGARHTPDTSVDPLFRALYDHGAEIVLSGHNHQYERFAPQNPDGAADRFGVRQFVVGTGGVSHYDFAAAQPNSQVRNGDTYGVLRLGLHADGYDWRFMPQAGRSFTDSGSGSCH